MQMNLFVRNFPADDSSVIVMGTVLKCEEESMLQASFSSSLEHALNHVQNFIQTFPV